MLLKYKGALEIQQGSYHNNACEIQNPTGRDIYCLKDVELYMMFSIF